MAAVSFTASRIYFGVLVSIAIASCTYIGLVTSINRMVESLVEQVIFSIRTSFSNTDFLISFVRSIPIEKKRKKERKRTALDDLLEEDKLSTRVTAIKTRSRARKRGGETRWKEESSLPFR